MPHGEKYSRAEGRGTPQMGIAQLPPLMWQLNDSAGETQGYGMCPIVCPES